MRTSNLSSPSQKLWMYINVPINMIHKIVPDDFAAESLLAHELAPIALKFGTIVEDIKT